MPDERKTEWVSEELHSRVVHHLHQGMVSHPQLKVLGVGLLEPILWCLQLSKMVENSILGTQHIPSCINGLFFLNFLVVECVLNKLPIHLHHDVLPILDLFVAFVKHKSCLIRKLGNQSSHWSVQFWDLEGVYFRRCCPHSFLPFQTIQNAYHWLPSI